MSFLTEFLGFAPNARIKFMGEIGPGVGGAGARGESTGNTGGSSSNGGRDRYSHENNYDGRDHPSRSRGLAGSHNGDNFPDPLGGAWNAGHLASLSNNPTAPDT